VTSEGRAVSAATLRGPAHDRLVKLNRDDCLRRLGRAGVGRVAVSVGALPAIFPVNYAMLDSDIVFRTGPGSKLDAALVGSVVAFEIDHFDAMSHTGWSVLVVGKARPIADPVTLARAASLSLTPWADGERDTFVRIETTVISGRQLT
jgi:nitroimidazol reductase NimA-like FMN-containing flavoprotein (pyridoxamine 5'-phosphate oxidase superfamily)